MSLEKRVSYQATNSYRTLNDFTVQTKNIWMACHGLGHLSRYFIEHFKNLDPHSNYIVAPQALSKYYQDRAYKYIGASWFTREDLDQETENVVHYLNAVYAQAILPLFHPDVNLILMGYSQGVSAITRWLAKSQVACSKLLLHSGGIPNELIAEDFKQQKNCKVILTYGNQDEYLQGSRLAEEITKYHRVWSENLIIEPFEGKHEVNEGFLEKHGNY